MKRTAIIVIILMGLSSALWLIRWKGDEPLNGSKIVAPYSREAFDRWLIADPERQAGFKQFAHYLASNDVGNVVQVWQLTRTDNNLARKCKRPQFLLPPREDWGRIVPVLALVRDEIEPVIGEVEVASSYRTRDFNGCIGGASRSQHLNFAAVDLIASKPVPNMELFGKLCSIHKRIGPSEKFGLGAYFDPAEPSKANGRFHVDVSGYRSWGYSKRAGSSGCRAFTA